jgi:HAD superfamily hydrolase (TIGR01490 family)
MKRLAIFDFCDTLVGLQSAERFVDFVVAQAGGDRFAWVDAVRRPLKKRRLLPNWLGKRLQLLKLRGLSEATVAPLIDRYVQEVLVPAQHPATLDRLRQHREAGTDVVILSAGYTPYIRRFAETIGGITVIATDLATRSGSYTGRIRGLNCYRSNKVRKLREQVDLGDYDLANSHVYSDELRDKPIFDLVGRKHLVIRAGAEPPTLPHGYDLFQLD